MDNFMLITGGAIVALIVSMIVDAVRLHLATANRLRAKIDGRLAAVTDT